MNLRRYYIAISLLLLGTGIAIAQESRKEFKIDFRANDMRLDTLYHENAARIKDLISYLHDINNDTTVEVRKIYFCGAASPEGNRALNLKLARGRLSTLENIIRKRVDIPESLVARDDSYIPWDYLKEQIELSDDVPDKEQVIEILNEKPEIVEYRPGAMIDNRVLKLQKLDNGKVWKVLNAKYFNRMRNAYTVIVIYKEPIPEPQPEPQPIPEPEPIPEPIPEPEPEPEPIPEPEAEPEPVAIPEEWVRQLHIKTNAIGWAMAVSNIAAEIDLTPHLSFTLPLYWSSWNYFTSTVKFRTLTLQPELRYWFSEHNDGWFVGAHFGLGWFNIATDGEYRYQDHDGNSPAIGGGLAAGFRIPISHDKKWKMEFSLGAGVYRAHYDKFRNEPNGLLVSTHKKTWFGIDQAAVTFSYTFDLDSKKGGAQ